MFPSAFTLTSPPLLTLPPIISIFSFASRFTFPPPDIPPSRPPEALFVIPLSDFISIFPPPDIFPLELTTSVASILISPPAFTTEPVPPPWSWPAIFNLVSLLKYTWGTRTMSPSTSISTYQMISFSKLLIWSGVRGFPNSNPNPSFTETALSNIDFIWSVPISPAYPNPSLIEVFINSFS